MSIDDLADNKNQVTWVCDDCGAREVRAIEQGKTFAILWAELKEDGWRAVLKEAPGVLKKIWVHYCPNCVSAFRKDRNHYG